MFVYLLAVAVIGLIVLLLVVKPKKVSEFEKKVETVMAKAGMTDGNHKLTDERRKGGDRRVSTKKSGS